MACPPMYTEPPKNMRCNNPQPVYVTGGALEVCNIIDTGGTGFDFHYVPICVAGENWTRVDRYKDGLLDVAGAYWFNAAGTQASAPASYTIGACPVTGTCQSWLASFSGDAIPAIQPYNSMAVYKPECCAVTVTTDAGTIVIPPGVRSYSPEKFDCALTTFTVAGACLADVYVFLQHTGA